MFQFFFNRNKFTFKDIGIKCDVHTHILPGVDDGAGDVASSIDILTKLSQNGVSKVVLTPHVSSGLYPNKAELLKLEFDRLKSSLPEDLSRKMSLKLASEYMIDEEFLSLNPKLTYSDRRILVEMSYSQRSINLLQAIFELVEEGYEPILAHPERYVFYFGSKKHPYALDELEKLREMGCRFQLNVMSLTGAYGPLSLSNLKYFLDHDWYSYIATDVHSAKQIDSFADFRIDARQFEKVRVLASTNEELF